MIVSLQQKIQNKESLYYMLYKVVKSKIFSSILLFTASIILVRHLPLQDFGLYALMIAFFAFFEVFLGGFDASLVRYISSSGKNIQYQLLSTVIFIKMGIVFIGLILIYIFYDYSVSLLNVNDKQLDIYNMVYFIMMIDLIFKSFIMTFSNLIIAYSLYKLVFKIAMFNGIMVLFSSIAVSIFNLGLIEYVFFTTIGNFLLIIFYFYIFKNSNRFLIHSIVNKFDYHIYKKIVVKYIWSYSMPLFGVSILSYLKNYLPTYLFGTMISLETLGVYTVFKKVFDFLHKGYDGILKSIYPKLFNMVHTNNKVIKKVFWSGFILRLFLFLVLYYGYDLILDIYNIEESQYDNLLFVVLLSCFLIGYFSTFSLFLIMSTDKTHQIFTSALTRAIFSILSMFILYNLFSVYGLIISVYIEIIFTTSIMIKITYKKYDNKYIFLFFYTIVFITSIVIWKAL